MHGLVEVNFGKLYKATFLSRMNRFLALVEWKGSHVLAHVPNSGRMRELLTPGNTVYIAPRHGGTRKTGYQLVLAKQNGFLVAIDSHIPNSLVEKALQVGALPEFRRYNRFRKEVVSHNSRLDFYLEGPGVVPCYLEVKSVTLVEDGLALFPDAPRGAENIFYT